MQQLYKRNSVVKFAVVIFALMTSTGCFGPHYIRADRSLRPPVPQHNGLTEHVVLVSIDGLRPDAITLFAAPTLQRLMREGSYTLKATTIVPSKTLPSHTSMLTGQPPEIHRVLWNTNAGLKQRSVRIPTVFELLHDQGYVTAAFFSKAKFTSLQRPGSLDYSQAPGGWFGYWRADRTIGDVERYLVTERPHLLFVHLGDPDHAGHESGWMGRKYEQAVEHIDRSLARLIAASERSFGSGNFTMIVTADHGGHERDHGSSDPQDVTIPWIAWGRGVQPALLAGSIETYDTASTVLWLFRISQPPAWAGNPVMDGFR